MLYVLITSLSNIIAYAKNEGLFDGVNPVQDVIIRSKAQEPRETYAYDLDQILQILEILQLLPKSIVATTAFAGASRRHASGIRVDRLHRCGVDGPKVHLEVDDQSTEDAGEPQLRTRNS